MSNKLTEEQIEQDYVARLKDRSLDWNVLKFQEEIDTKYKRAQMRYIGRGATANADPNVIDGEHFTLSTMVLPAGSVGPLHLHDDVELVFFILIGQNITAMIQESDDSVVLDVPLEESDCIWGAPGVYRGMRNEGKDEAIMFVMLGAITSDLP